MTRSRDVANIDTILTTKGDIYAASAAYTPTRLAVGESGSTLVADSSTSTGLRWGNNYGFTAGKNKIINSDFGIWQRGTSFSASTGIVRTADRFYVNRNGSGATVTISQQTFTPGAAPVAGYEGKFFWRFNQTVAGTGATFNVLNTEVEDVQNFAGQTITISFWAKADAARSVNVTPYQAFGSGGSATANPGGQSVTLSTSWTRYSLTYTMGSLSGKTIGAGSFFGIEWGFPVNTVQTIDIWGVQAEIGNVATAFQTATGTLAGELAAAYRYYYRLNPTNGTLMGTGVPFNTTGSLITIPYPVTMRIRPTALEQTGTASDYKTLRANAGAFDNCTAVPTYDAGTNASFGMIQTTSANLVAGNGVLFFSNSSTAYLGWSAEL